MSTYWNYEGYKHLCEKSDNDDIPIISCERNARSECYQDDWSHPCQSWTWNEEPSFTQETEQPEMSNMERILKDAIERLDRQHQELDELDEILDWNFEPNQERPCDTFTNPNPNWDNIEDIEFNDYYSDVDVVYSNNIVFQDNSDEDMYEYEKDDEVTNCPHEYPISVLQEPLSLEAEVTKNLDLEDSDYSESDFEESVENEPEEDLVIPDLESVDSIDSTSILQELQELLEISDQELDKLVEQGMGDDLFSHYEFEDLYQANSPKSQTEMVDVDLDELHSDKLSMGKLSTHSNGKYNLSKVDDQKCTMPQIKESQSGLISNSLPYKSEYILLKESDFSGGINESNIVHEQINNSLDKLSMLERSIEEVHINYFEEPPDYFCVLVKGFSEDVEISSHSYLKAEIIKFIIRPLKEWRVTVYVLSFSWRMFYRNEKTKEDILLCEYDEKGGGNIIEYWL